MLLVEITWRGLYQRKQIEEKYWWKSLFEEDFEKVSELFESFSSVGTPGSVAATPDTNGSSHCHSHTGAGKVLVMDDQQGILREMV